MVGAEGLRARSLAGMLVLGWLDLLTAVFFNVAFIVMQAVVILASPVPRLVRQPGLAG